MAGILVDGVSNVRSLVYAHTSAVTAGQIIVINEQVFMAVNAADANVSNVYVYQGRITFVKNTGEAMAPGELIYWDATAGEATKVSTDNTKIGICLEDAVSAATSVMVMLREKI